MGALIGIPEWMTATAFVVGGLAILFGIGWLNLRRTHARVAAHRPNPTEAEFLTMMSQDCSQEAARFVWEQALFYVEPRLTPHPDDLLIDDLCIDDDDIGMDWPQVWVEQQNLKETDLPDWPKDWPLTVRNYARWCDLGAKPLP